MDTTLDFENEGCEPVLSAEGVGQLFLTGKFSDIKFKVGTSQTKIFHAHKIILSLASTVFKKWFYNLELEPGTTLKIRNVEPDTFENFLRLIYKGEYKPLLMADVIDVFILSKRFDVPDVAAACLNYIEQNFTRRNLCTVYELALTGNHESLRAAAKKAFLLESFLDIELSDFHMCKPEVMEAIVKDVADEMDVTKLFRGLMSWTSIFSCSISSKCLLREMINPFLPHIRFLNMPIDDFTKFVRESGVLTKDEFEAIQSHLSGSSDAPLPSWCLPKIIPDYYVLQVPYVVKENKDATMKNATILSCRFVVVRGDVLVNGVGAMIRKTEVQQVRTVKEAEVFAVKTSPTIERNFTAQVELNGNMMKFMFPCPFSLRSGDECTMQIQMPDDCKHFFEEGQYSKQSMIVNDLKFFSFLRLLSPKLETYGLISTLFLHQKK